MTEQTTLDRLATTRTIERSGGHLYTYVDPDGPHGPFPGATAIVALQEALGGVDGLLNWAVGLALDDALARVQADLAAGVEIDWAYARTMGFAAKNGPRDIGVSVHNAVDRYNRGQLLDLDATTAPYVAHYANALRRESINVLASERFCVNVPVGFGGTYDSLVEIGRERGPLDVKTGRERASAHLQLTGLSMCQVHGEVGLEAEPMPVLDSVGWILLLRPDGYQLVRHEITDEDRDHFIRLVHTYHEIRGWSARQEER